MLECLPQVARLWYAHTLRTTFWKAGHMPAEPLPPDPDSLEKWKNMQQNAPSKDALPPMTAGNRWAFGLLIVMGVLIILALLLQGGAP